MAAEYKMYVDGKEYKTLNPIIDEDTETYISLRDFANIIGGELAWENASKTAMLDTGYWSATFQIGNDKMRKMGLNWKLEHRPFLEDSRLYMNIEDLKLISLSKVEWDENRINITVIDTNTSYSFEELVPDFLTIDRIGFAPGSLAYPQYIYSPEVVQKILKQFIENRFKVSSKQLLSTGPGYYDLCSKNNRISLITFYGESRVEIGMVTYELEKPLTLTPYNLVGESDY